MREILKKQYEKLENSGYEVLGIFLYGSQNYKLNHEKSDIDTRAIVIPSLEDLIYGKEISKEMHMDEGLCDVKDIRKMIHCYLSQNPTYIETLYTEHYYLNPKYDFNKILEKRDEISSYCHYKLVLTLEGMGYQRYKEIIANHENKAKKLAELLRAKDMLERFNKEPYEKILVPVDREYLLDMKTKKIIPDYKKEAEEAYEWMKKYKTEYLKNTVFKDNPEIVEFLYKESEEFIKQNILKKEG